jgi:hypothetical protein
MRRKFTMEPERKSRIIKEGTFVFASARARDSVVTAVPRYPLVSNAFFNDCAKDSDFRKMSTESRTSAMVDLAVDIA